jgi:hypothetical protein
VYSPVSSTADVFAVLTTPRDRVVRVLLASVDQGGIVVDG